MYVLQGLDHCTTAPVGLYGDVLIDDNEIKYSRSLTEKASPVNHNSKLDRLSEREKVNIAFCNWLLQIFFFIGYLFFLFF